MVDWHRNRVPTWWIIDIECIACVPATATTTASWKAHSKTVGPYSTGSHRDDVGQIKGPVGTSWFTAQSTGKIFFESSEESLVGERHIMGSTTSATSFLELLTLKHILATKHSETVENSIIRLMRDLRWSLVPIEKEERRSFDHSIHLHGECCWCSGESVLIFSVYWGLYGKRGLYGRCECVQLRFSLPLAMVNVCAIVHARVLIQSRTISSSFSLFRTVNGYDEVSEMIFDRFQHEKKLPIIEIQSNEAFSRSLSVLLIAEQFCFICRKKRSLIVQCDVDLNIDWRVCDFRSLQGSPLGLSRHRPCPRVRPSIRTSREPRWASVLDSNTSNTDNIVCRRENNNREPRWFRASRRCPARRWKCPNDWIHSSSCNRWCPQSEAEDERRSEWRSEHQYSRNSSRWIAKCAGNVRCPSDRSCCESPRCEAGGRRTTTWAGTSEDLRGVKEKETALNSSEHRYFLLT